MTPISHFPIFKLIVSVKYTCVEVYPKYAQYYFSVDFRELELAECYIHIGEFREMTNGLPPLKNEMLWLFHFGMCQTMIGIS